jgi:hypothetical protein
MENRGDHVSGRPRSENDPLSDGRRLEKAPEPVLPSKFRSGPTTGEFLEGELTDALIEILAVTRCPGLYVRLAPDRKIFMVRFRENGDQIHFMLGGYPEIESPRPGRRTGGSFPGREGVASSRISSGGEGSTNLFSVHRQKQVVVLLGVVGPIPSPAEGSFPRGRPVGRACSQDGSVDQIGLEMHDDSLRSPCP